MVYEEFRVAQSGMDGCKPVFLDDLPMCINGHHCLARDDDRLKLLNLEQFAPHRCQTCSDIKITPVFSS